MIIANVAGREHAPGHIVAVFGAGLIGSSIVDTLRSRGPAEMMRLPLDWQLVFSGHDELSRVQTALTEPLVSGARLSVVWSAGRSGFASSEVETAAELQAFREVLGMTTTLAERFPRAKSSFHLISSAGGLFEGQRHVTHTSIAAPLRPYGRLKLEQEKLLIAATPLASRVYRVSSAYGHLRPYARAGLIGTLLCNAAQRAVTSITGDMSTLRDFVFSDDIAQYVSNRVLAEQKAGSEVTWMTNGRPASLLEIQHIVEDVVGRKVLVAYSAGRANAQDITFASGLSPDGWRPSDVCWNVRTIYRQALCTGALVATAGMTKRIR